jgi:hypothetical protein
MREPEAASPEVQERLPDPEARGEPLAAAFGGLGGGVRDAAGVLRLQRVAGNRATVRMLQRKELTWHEQRAAEIKTALKGPNENWEGTDPPGAYRVFNGLSNEDQIRIYRLLGEADRKKLEDNLDKTTGDRARMYQAIQQAKIGALGKGNAAADWWREKAEEVHWAIRCNKFVNYEVEEDPQSKGRSRGAYWILSGHNDAARQRLMSFLDAESLDALLRHGSEADQVPGAADIIKYATTVRETRPKRTRAFAVEVGERKVGEGTISLGSTGQVVTGGKLLASGPVAIAGTMLAGGVAMVALQTPTLAPAGAVPTPLNLPTPPPGVEVGTRAEQIERALKSISDLEKTLNASKEVKEAADAAKAVQTAAQRARWARLSARGGLFVILTLIVAGTIIVVAAAISSAEGREELPEGGLEGVAPTEGEPRDAGAAEPAIAPGTPVPAPAVDPSPAQPAQAPGQAPAVPAEAPGKAGTGPAQAPGTSKQRLQLGGVKFDISDTRSERLGKAEQAEKWTDIEGRERTSLGKAYNSIVQLIVREVAARGWTRTAYHYVEVKRELLDREAQQGGRILITEGRLPGVGRFDIALIDFDAKTIELIDLTAMRSGTHAGKTVDYQTALENLTGFKVGSYEAHYVGDDEKLADELVIKKVGGK